MTRVCAAATPLVGSLGRGRRAAPPRAGRRPRARCARAAPLAAPPFAQSALLFASRRALYQHCCPFAPLALNTPPRSFNYPTPPFVHARRRPAAGRGRGAPGSTPGGRPARFSQSGRPGGPSTPPHRVSAPARSPTVQCLVSLSLSLCSPSALAHHPMARVRICGRAVCRRAPKRRRAAPLPCPFRPLPAVLAPICLTPFVRDNWGGRFNKQAPPSNQKKVPALSGNQTPVGSDEATNPPYSCPLSALHSPTKKPPHPNHRPTGALAARHPAAAACPPRAPTAMRRRAPRTRDGGGG